ncbi:hypothetical protein [Neobacillus mesonae]|uniref:hypothetical protein n=1 Tax=Neobacillus mesonae TaxID=1193713 RepID=UPI00203CAE25|nr:hypothetical protein [Neobacillus mesonae]
MNKVILSKEEAKALEVALERSSGDKSSIVQWHSHNLWDDKTAPLNDLDLDTVCQALYVGYEVEPGPEEKVINFYEANAANPAIEFAVRQTLKLLNYQIKGINC